MEHLASRIVNAVKHSDDKELEDCVAVLSHTCLRACGPSLSPLVSFLASYGDASYDTLLGDHHISLCKHLFSYMLQSSTPHTLAVHTMEVIALQIHRLRRISFSVAPAECCAVCVLLCSFHRMYPLARLTVSSAAYDTGIILLDFLPAEARITLPIQGILDSPMADQATSVMLDLLQDGWVSAPQLCVIASAIRDSCGLSYFLDTNFRLSPLGWMVRGCLEHLESLTAFASKLNSTFDDVLEDSRRSDGLRLFILSHRHIASALFSAAVSHQLDSLQQQTICTALEHTFCPVLRLWKGSFIFELIASLDQCMSKATAAADSLINSQYLSELVNTLLDSLRSISVPEPLRGVSEAIETQLVYILFQCCAASLRLSVPASWIGPLCAVFCSCLEKLCGGDHDSVRLLYCCMEHLLWELDTGEEHSSEESRAFLRFCSKLNGSETKSTDRYRTLKAIALYIAGAQVATPLAIQPALECVSTDVLRIWCRQESVASVLHARIKQHTP
jgi:hypothetical protein